MGSQRLQALSNRKLCRVAKTVAALGPKGPFLYGLVSEWLMEPVLKTGNRRRFVGSNPTLSATLESPLGYDIYPLYWITSKGGILMRYSYEFKRKAIELFYLNTKLWDTMVLLINLKDDYQRIAK